MPERVAGQLTEVRIREILEEYRAAYERRDRAALLDFFADDAVMTLAPGAFRGREGVAAVFDWDLRDTSSARLRPLGVGLLVKGNVAVREVVFAATWKGIRYEYPNLAVFEFDDDGKIRAYRSYYDKLGIEQRIAAQFPGIQGWLFRLMVNRLVREGEKGIDAHGESEWWTPGETNP
jgi:ketosteroid isomerase-like protein